MSISDLARVKFGANTGHIPLALESRSSLKAKKRERPGAALPKRKKKSISSRRASRALNISKYFEYPYVPGANNRRHAGRGREIPSARATMIAAAEYRRAAYVADVRRIDARSSHRARKRVAFFLAPFETLREFGECEI